MRIVILSLFVLCFHITGRGQNTIDVLDYKYSIYLNDNNDSVKGIAEITFISTQSTSSISLDFSNQLKGKGMKVTSVLSGPRSATLPAYSHQNDKIQIQWSRELKKGDTGRVSVVYGGVPIDGLIISKTKFGRRSFFADNWPDRGHNWIPCHDDPADKASVEFIVTAPKHYRVVANGVQIDERTVDNNYKLTHWKEDVPISTKVMVIGVAEFAVDLAGTVNGIPVYSWVFPENKKEGFYDYALAKDILPFFIDHVGPYGYKKLANVQSKTRFGGLENANTIFYSENSVSGTRKSEQLLTHEIAHQWFGNMATEKSFGHVWLSEGFATYFTILYIENKYGKDKANEMLLEDRNEVIAFSKENDKPIVNTAETNYMRLLNANSYQKGGWILHMLRKELSDSVFWRSIRKYYADYGGGVADTRDLQKVFETVSGKDMDQFFDQWLYTPGQPMLDITWRYDDIEKTVYIQGQQIQENKFHFPLTLKINDKKEKIRVSEDAFTLKIKSDKKPTSIIADPDTEILMSCTIREK